MNSTLLSFTHSSSLRKLRATFVVGLTLVSLAAAFGKNSATGYKFTHMAGPLSDQASATSKGSTETFAYPIGVAVDSAGNAYVADQFNHTIRKITPDGVVTILAGTAGVAGSTDGIGSAAQFNSPTGVAVDREGNIYVSDQNNHIIRKITTGSVVSTFAGASGLNGSNDGVRSTARFYIPASVAVDYEGNVYVADLGNDTIRKIAANGIVTTLAGTAGDSGFSDGTGSAARFISPKGLAVDKAGNIYVADLGNDIIRKITPGGMVTTLAGTAGNPGSSDGTGYAAQFNGPISVAVDRAGNVYVSDSFSTIRKITAVGAVTTEAGVAPGISADKQFVYPSGVAVDDAGNLYIADNGANALHRGVPTREYAYLHNPAAK